MENFNTTKVINDEHLTPPELIEALGPFDLDPFAPIERPWEIAKKHFTFLDNGLLLPWEGFVWLNPPYNNKFVNNVATRAASYKNCLLLIFARTETQTWQNLIFPYAYKIFFIKGRLNFYTNEGKKQNPSPAPSALICYNFLGYIRIRKAQKKGFINGYFIQP